MTVSSVQPLPVHEEDHNYASSTKKHLTHFPSEVVTATVSTASGPPKQDRETASHGESTSYDIVNERRDSGHAEAKVIIKTPSKKHIHRTSSRDRQRTHRSDSGNLYELSTDIADKAIECLEKKYGGKENANQAARAIQQCYRHWVLNKGFKRVRAYSGRKRSLTMPEKQFEKLKQKSLVFYGPENPVMIVDEESERSHSRAPIAQFEETLVEDDSSSETGISELDSSKQSIVEIAQEEGSKICSQNPEDSDEADEEEEEEEDGRDDDDDETSTDDNLDKSAEKELSVSQEEQVLFVPLIDFLKITGELLKSPYFLSFHISACFNILFHFECIPYYYNLFCLRFRFENMLLTFKCYLNPLKIERNIF